MTATDAMATVAKRLTHSSSDWVTGWLERWGCNHRWYKSWATVRLPTFNDESMVDVMADNTPIITNWVSSGWGMAWARSIKMVLLVLVVGIQNPENTPIAAIPINNRANMPVADPAARKAWWALATAVMRCHISGAIHHASTKVTSSPNC
jgi:hypothetical protein